VRTQNPIFMKTNLRILLRLFTVLCCLLFICAWCQKNDTTTPELTTSEVIGITSNWAISGGNITNDGGADIEERGVCWSTTDPPTIDDHRATAGFGSGEFACNFKNLEGNTTYYLSAYASNSDYTGYGEVVSFTTPPTAIDVEGNEVPTVVIGTQTWMARNLSITHYRNGDPITYIPEEPDWGKSGAGEYCDYDYFGELGGAYGNFYNWYVVSDPRGITPDGWHVPSDEEWTILIDYLGGVNEAGEKLRETGFTHWLRESNDQNNPEGTNESGFTALGAGMADYDHRGYEARFWTSTIVNTDGAKYCGVNCKNAVYMAFMQWYDGMSIRLIKDQ
jgi:uncharacterized protein (TIGR02145 family)